MTTKLVPINVTPEVKKIIELNKGLGKTDIGKSLTDLLEGSPKYLKLKEANKHIQDVRDEFEDIKFPLKIEDI